jgi:Icc protein
MVLNGHKHVSNAWKIENTVVLNSGTATTRRLYADNYPSYNQLIIKDKMLLVNLVKTETGQKRLLAHYSLETKSNEDVPMTHLTY